MSESFLDLNTTEADLKKKEKRTLPGSQLETT